MLSRYNRILVAEYRVDFRKAHDGLLAEARKHNCDPFAGDVIIFVSRCKSKIKALYADKTGLWLSHKVFTADTIKTKLSFLTEPTVTEVSPAALSMLLEGTAYRIEKKSKEWSPGTL